MIDLTADTINGKQSTRRRFMKYGITAAVAAGAVGAGFPYLQLGSNMIARLGIGHMSDERNLARLSNWAFEFLADCNVPNWKTTSTISSTP